MSIAEKLPGMTDEHLKALHANASRLAAAGAPIEQRNAGRLLPLIEAEIEARAAAKAQAQQQRRDALRTAQRTVKERTVKARAPRQKAKA